MGRSRLGAPEVQGRRIRDFLLFLSLLYTSLPHIEVSGRCWGWPIAIWVTHSWRQYIATPAPIGLLHHALYDECPTSHVS